MSKTNKNTMKTIQENNMLEVSLPFFSGFYESELSAMMDQEIESEAEYNGKEPRLE